MESPNPPAKHKYPTGATLRCPCGREGSVAAVSGHRARSKDPLCKSVERLYVVGVDEIPPTPPVLPQPLTPQLSVGDFADPVDWGAEANAAFDENETFEANGAYEPMPEAESAPRPGGKKAATRRGNNGNGNLEWRQPVPGAATARYPNPSMIRSAVELPVRTHAYYEAARFDPDLAFEGTLSEFVDMCVDQFFHALGYVGFRLVKDRPQRLEVG